MYFLFRVRIHIVILVVAFFNNFSCELERAQDDVIVSLPGLNFDIKFEHYSGYLNVSPTRRLHYWFVESQSNPANDPLLFWFNGGPGCSSLFGLLGEIGPYLVNADGETLRENPHTWNKLANVVFVESPVGTGYSYSKDGNITNSDDQHQMRPLTVQGCGEDVVWFCTVRNKDNAAMTQADQEGCAHVWTQLGKSNKRKADGSELRKYLCQGCRTLKNSKATKQEHEDKEIPYRRLILNSDGTGQWVEQDEVGVHFCKPRTATELMGKEVFAKHVEGIKAGSLKLPPTKSLTNLETAYSRIFSDLGEDGIAEARDGGFPNRDAALKKIRRVISKKYPKIPNLESLNLPEFEEVSFTLRSSKNEASDLYKEKLLQLAEENIAIFASKAQLKLLASCKYIFSDGTFKTRPNGSYQVYRTCGTMVNAETGEYLILPLVTAIMKRKDSVSYHHYWDAANILYALHVFHYLLSKPQKRCNNTSLLFWKAIISKGVAIGNGLLAYDDDVPTNYPWHSTVINYAYSHGLVDEDLWQYLKNECCGGCAENCDFFKLQGKCGAKVKEAQRLMRSLPSAYNIYSRCPHRKYMFRQSDSVSPETEIIIPSAHDNIDENGECVPESALKNYLRKPSVRHALNIPPEVESWEQCRLVQLWEHGYIHQYFNMTKFVLEIVNSNVPVLLFFGDTDLVCNFMLGEQFAANLGLKQTSSKNMWLHEGVPAGSKTEYGSHLTFITVLGAGHMAPRDRAPEMHQAIKRFISGISI